jgi:plastocyanin
MRDRRVTRVLAPAAALAAVAGLALSPSLRPAAAGPAGATTIDVGDFWFCDSSFMGEVCETTVSAGDTVIWHVTAGTHTSTHCGVDCGMVIADPQNLWHSGFISAGQSFQRTFDTPGVFEYQCTIHPFDMRGRIIVSGGPGPTPPPTPGRRAGDADCSGNVTSIDAALILQRSAALIEGVSCEDNADVNLDGAITSVDAALVLQRVAGLIPAL